MTEEKRKIIVAEDDRSLCEVLKTILEDEGYIVDCVYDGLSLLSYLKENQDVDIVILDLIMPERNGTSVMGSVRSVSPASKIVIHTGYDSYRGSIYAKDADAYINKTAGPEALISVLEKLFREQ